MRDSAYSVPVAEVIPKFLGISSRRLYGIEEGKYSFDLQFD